jgi:rod shape-determining protein MreB and related proteins
VGDGTLSRRDLALDLGTASTRVYEQGHGIVFDEPTVVALHGRTAEVLGVGRQAWAMAADRPGDVVAVRPLHRGAISNFELAEQMIRMILRAVGMSRFSRPRVLVCVPSALTPVERRAVEEAVTEAGARSATLVDEPLAAAIGAGLPIHDPVGSMVVDVGGGISEMAMLALGGVVTWKAVPVGGLDMDEAIQRHIRTRYELSVGEAAAEQIKNEVGSAYPRADAAMAEVQGRHLRTGEQTVVLLGPQEVREVLEDIVGPIVRGARECLAESPPELAHDVLETGLFLTGGGGLLRGLDMRLAQDCEVPVHRTEHPTVTVAIGAGRLLDYEPDQRAAFLTAHRPVP